jgi:hypothetical protein
VRLFPRRLFKFRRKKTLNRIKQNFNNNHHIIQANPKMTIEQLLNRQWIQTLQKPNTDSSSVKTPISNQMIRFSSDLQFDHSGNEKYRF